MPNKSGRFHLYSDTSKYVTSSTLYQIQGGKPKLIAYASKRLPEAARNHSITELELCGLAINVASFAHLLKRVNFDAIADIGQGRAGLRRKHMPDHINQPFDVTRRIPERSKMATGKTNNPQHTSTMHDRGINSNKSFSPDVLLHPLHKPLLKQQDMDKAIPNNNSSSINLDIEENSPF